MSQTSYKIVYFVILMILLFSIYGSLTLSITDFNDKNVCPKFVGVPACYLVLISFVLVALVHLLKGTFKRALCYYVFLAFPLLLALSGTISELSGRVVCPRTPSGTPMCYISLGLCTALVLLKMAETRHGKLFI